MAQTNEDQGGSGMIGYANGVLGFLNSHAASRSWTMEFLCERGRVLTRNHHAWFELWGRGEEELDGEFQRQFPFPWHSRSSMVDAIEGVARSIEAGVEESCPGEFGREALEIGIAIRESYRSGARMDLPLQDRSLRLGSG